MIDLDMIHAALGNDEFFLEYLPIWSIEHGRCVGAEALIRWQRPSGVVLPDDFIPLTEGTPLSGLVTYCVIDRVAAEMGDWLRHQDGVEIHINVPLEILCRGGLEYAFAGGCVPALLQAPRLSAAGRRRHLRRRGRTARYATPHAGMGCHAPLIESLTPLQMAR